MAERFDLCINLSESIEGALLTLPGRLTHDYPLGVRQRLYGSVNYLERTHDIAGVPYDFAPKFYATKAEIEWAMKERGKSLGAPVVLMCLHGSSVHKVYPWTHHVTRWLIEQHGAHVWLSGDKDQGVQLQSGMMEVLERDGVDMSKIHGICGKWNIRQALAFAQVVDCAVGPETGVMNAIAGEMVPKVIFLSHSSHENLTKHWKRAAVIMPDKKVCPCYPCHQLHYSWEHCVQNEQTQCSQCASAIAPELVFELILRQIGLRQAA